jgi:hypothetical protein
MSQTAEYMPGPWTHDRQILPVDEGGEPSECYGAYTVENENCQIIAYLNEELPNYRANARLIAAAPELLTALEELFIQYDKPLSAETMKEGVALWKKARAAIAIAKAEGESCQ